MSAPTILDRRIGRLRRHLETARAIPEARDPAAFAALQRQLAELERQRPGEAAR